MNHIPTSASFPTLAAANGRPRTSSKPVPTPANPAVDAAAPTPMPIDADDPRPRWTSTEILRGSAEVLIQHDSGTYRLRRTAQGKLILTK